MRDCGITSLQERDWNGSGFLAPRNSTGPARVRENVLVIIFVSHYYSKGLFSIPLKSALAREKPQTS